MFLRDLSIAVLISTLVLSVSAADPQKTTGKHACFKCHLPEQRTMQGTPHEEKGCEGCHGPGEQHLRGGGDPAKIFSFVKASPAEVRERCGQCHRDPVMERHAEGDVACISCHSSHHYVRKKYLLKADDNLMQNPA
ncbi:MAG TPA: hypothetical protein VN577_17095 [Terriglobales bacterium]|nr:hypothetical protein [Terriglobales bacterium]